MEAYHLPVMPEECINGLDIKPGGVYLDGTAGGGGHSSLIAERLADTGRLICMDKDDEAITAITERLGFHKNIIIVKADFANTPSVLAGLGVTSLDGALLDLGVSSRQLDEPSRGFSFLKEARLDMRMDRSAQLSAHEVVNAYPEARLREIFKLYGEERYAGRVAAAIAQSRFIKAVNTTLELASIVSASIPRKAWDRNRHPATRVFQAIRIEVNGELEILDGALSGIIDRLNAQGRFCVITFHSLEDRIVKTAFKELAEPCRCPRDLPYCVCGKHPRIRYITRKPLVAGEAEISANARARSAKLRIVEKI